MSTMFFSRSVDSLRLEGQRQARLTTLARSMAKRLPPDGRPKDFFPPRVSMGMPAIPLRGIPQTKTVPTPPPAAVLALSRLGFGPRPGDVDAFNTLGATDAERLEAYVDEQLDPASIDDSAADARIAQSGFTTLGKTVTQLWQEHATHEEWEQVIRPADETEMATFLRAIFSKRQLFELLVDFWHNHFNAYAWDWPMAPMWVHTDRDAIRGHALGNFRQMVEAVAKTPAMLHYLNNNVNSVEDANENFARELMELQILGAENYYGSIPESDVPQDGEGRPLGYVEETVIAAARCLTGWTMSDRDWDPQIGNTGEFLYHDAWHDHAAKTVLGTDLPANQAPMKDGQDLFDILVGHPGTAVHIASKLCRRLIGDFPPQSVVDAAAAVFTAEVDAPDQIAQVVRSIVLSDAFLTTWGDKVKRPFEIVTSAFRGAEIDLPFAIGDDATNYFLYSYYHTGQPLFGWHPPNGYPDIKPAWNSTSPRVSSWRMANFLITISDDADIPHFDPMAVTPADVRSAHDLVTFWTERVLGYAAAAAEFDELVEFMAQGRNPAYDLPLGTDEQTRERLRALVGLIFMSPSFLWR